MPYNWLGSFCLPSSLTTIDGNATNLLSVPVLEGNHIGVSAIVNGMAYPNSNGAITSFVRFSVLRQTGTNVTIIGKPIIESMMSSNNLKVAVNCVVDVINNLALIQVNGITNQTWNWQMSYQFLKCSM